MTKPPICSQNIILQVRKYFAIKESKSYSIVEYYYQRTLSPQQIVLLLQMRQIFGVAKLVCAKTFIPTKFSLTTENCNCSPQNCFFYILFTQEEHEQKQVIKQDKNKDKART